MGYSSDGKEGGSDGKECSKDGGTDSGCLLNQEILFEKSFEESEVFVL